MSDPDILNPDHKSPPPLKLTKGERRKDAPLIGDLQLVDSAIRKMGGWYAEIAYMKCEKSDAAEELAHLQLHRAALEDAAERLAKRIVARLKERLAEAERAAAQG